MKTRKKQIKAKAMMIRPQGYKTFFMLNSAEHDIFAGNNYENANNRDIFMLSNV